MMDLRFRPLTRWPAERRTPRDKQKNGAKVFSLSYGKTLQSLDRELRHLEAKDAVIEADVQSEDDIRLDGFLRGSARLKSSAIVLSFTSKHGPLKIHCDYFQQWAHNLRAIALHLERLRLATQFGIGQHGEQYRGWKALPPGAAPESPRMTAEEAAAAIAEVLGLPALRGSILAHADVLDDAYRSAAVKVHPDQQNGSREAWDKLELAKRTLDIHHGRAREASA